MENDKKKSTGLMVGEKINMYELFPPKKKRKKTLPLENTNPVPLCYNGVDEVDLIAM